ncbi:hypothetical protein [Halomonas cerina]|uniref:Uncharacterized protein n=1 Tax=Halomonas cerina TaxID=447424 RepID=A0A839V191_9GAMM|nr:hypothetical protein [Halomonas cerina]MBB3188961.1 hypothetical protein [Halomonas cerina]
MTRGVLAMVLAGCWLLVGTSACLVVLEAAGRAGVLRALEAATGEVRWARRFEGWIYPPARQAGGVVTGGEWRRRRHDPPLPLAGPAWETKREKGVSGCKVRQPATTNPVQASIPNDKT